MSEPDPPEDLRGPSPTLVELLFEAPPSIDYAAVAARAGTRAGTAATLIGDGAAIGIAFPAHAIHYADGDLPMSVWLLRAGERPGSDEWIEQTMRQSWGWRDAEAVVRQAKAAVLVSDIMAGPLDPRVRLPVYHAVLAAVVEDARPIALRWITGERFVRPETYLMDLAEDPTAFESTVNVRYVTLADRPGEQIMDTVGMAPFGLPDVQCHFVSLDPGQVAGKLLSVARYLFDNGDVIENGHTVPGLDGDERWPCLHELALLGPSREVLDLFVGPHGPSRD